MKRTRIRPNARVNRGCCFTLKNGQECCKHARLTHNGRRYCQHHDPNKISPRVLDVMFTDDVEDAKRQLAQNAIHQRPRGL